MRRIAVTLAAVFAFLAPCAGQAGSTFDGTFSHNASGLVEYFSLTQAGNHVAGFFQAEQADASAPDGVKETRINVSGVTDGDRINFRQGEGMFSTTLGWDARSNGNGFTLTFQTQGGLLGSNQFTPASNESVNAAIINLRQSIGQVRQQQAVYEQRANLHSEIIDSEIRIQKNLNNRPRILQAMIKAKAALAKGKNEVATANQEMINRQAEQNRQQAMIDDAAKTASTPDEYSHVNDLRQIVNDDRGKVNDARGDLNSANGDVRSAQEDLDSAHRDLRNLDDRIAELRGIIRRDIALGGRP